MKIIFTAGFIFLLNSCFAQLQHSTSDSITIKASDKYNKSGLHNFFWGKHYRKEWNTPVTVKKVMLDTMRGGLFPYETGGSRQTKSIRVRDNNKREYAFRSVDKSFGKALPDIVQGTFIERAANDQVTISHPYSALVVAPLAQAAGIYHPIPELVYVPKQQALGKFSDSTGDVLYTFEQRPDENWSTAPNFGYAKKIVSTEKMLDKILDDNDNAVDQKAFLRARLFDLWIGDWGRHEDQWRWAVSTQNKKTVYEPIPRDRDNAFTKFDGLLLKLLIPAAKAKHLQTFDYKLKDVNRFAFPARNMDHHLLNELTEEDWLAVATELQSKLTDAVIDDAVRAFPPEVFPISGPEIAAKLKARRALLPKWAETYFKFLSTDVEITGTRDDEKFEVKRLSREKTEINIYKITNKGNAKSDPFYHRIFNNKQTHEIRLYGIAGNDVYTLTGKTTGGIKVRMIGGPGKDIYSDESTVSGPSHKTKIYDNPGNDIQKTTKETSVITSKDSTINEYKYKYFEYNEKGIKPLLFYNNDDRVFAGVAFISKKQKWRKDPFANTQYIDGKYSLSQKGFSSTYYSNFLDLIGKWNVKTYANYDEIRWTNFFGLGNETKLVTKDRDFYRIRSEEFLAKLNTDRVFHNRQRISIGVNYHTYRIISDTGRFLIKTAVSTPAMHGHESFVGAEANYVYQNINDSVLPTKGFAFMAYANYSNNLSRRTNDVGKYGAETNIYLPLSKKFGLMVRGGASTLSGDPQFYQYNSIGGTETLRGYQRNRFYGNSTVFNQNELRFITNFRSFLFNGKIGVFGLYDAGRVWLDKEKTDKWHTSVGGGIILSPFNRLSISASYAVSPEDANIHIKLMKPF